MAGITVSDQYDALLTTTLRNYRKQLINNIFEPTRFLSWLMRKRGGGAGIGTFDLQDGGFKIVEHLLYGKNTTVGFKEAYGEIDVTPMEGMTIAEYPWREVAGSIVISNKEKRQNSGEHQLINLLKAKTMQTERSMRDKVSEKLFANVSSETAPDITSLLTMVSNTPSSTTLGGVSGATYSWWRNHQADTGAYSSNLLDKLKTAMNTVSKWGNTDVIICSQTALEYYERLADGAGTPANHLRRFPLVRNEKAAEDLGYEIFTYKGADMLFDFDLASGTPATGETMIGLNSNHIRLCVDTQTNFVTGEFVQPKNQTVQVATILAMLNLTCNNRAAHWILHGIDAS